MNGETPCCVIARLAAAFALPLLFLTGCQTPRPLAVTGHTYTQPVEHRANTNIVAIDVGLTGIPHGDIQVARQHTSWTDDGRLKISVELENRTRKGLPVQIQTAFKDENDNFLNDQTPYYSVVLPRNQTYLYEAVAMDPRAARAHIRVRYARRDS